MLKGQVSWLSWSGLWLWRPSKTHWALKGRDGPKHLVNQCFFYGVTTFSFGFFEAPSAKFERLPHFPVFCILPTLFQDSTKNLKDPFSLFMIRSKDPANRELETTFSVVVLEMPVFMKHPCFWEKKSVPFPRSIMKIFRLEKSSNPYLTYL